MLRWSSPFLLLALWFAFAACSSATAACPAAADPATEATLAVEPVDAAAPLGAGAEAAPTALPKEVSASAGRGATRQAPRARWHRFLPGMFK